MWYYTIMKEFKEWCLRKAQVDRRKLIYPKNREIWWIVLGVNIGHEQDGIGKLFERPALILKKFPNGTCLVLPLTKAGDDSKYYYKLDYETDSYVALQQARLISNKRLNRDIRRINRGEFVKIVSAFRKLNSLNVK
jgi:mRNA interferase MazF